MARWLSLPLTLLTIAAPFRIVVVVAVNEVGLLTLQQPGRGIAEADCYRCFRCVCVCVCAWNAYVHTCVRACVSVCACAYQREWVSACGQRLLEEDEEEEQQKYRMQSKWVSKCKGDISICIFHFVLLFHFTLHAAAQLQQLCMRVHFTLFAFVSFVSFVFGAKTYTPWNYRLPLRFKELSSLITTHTVGHIITN